MPNIEPFNLILKENSQKQKDKNNIIKVFRTELNSMVYMNVYYVPAVLHLAHHIGGIPKPI